MSDIPPDVVDRMMVKCGRRCCICKRFRPTKLQVHHIHEKGEGGSDEEDNLVVTCFSCHSDVHTKVPFARRFSQAELKGHRDTLIKQVADGVLPAEDTDDTDDMIRNIVRELRAVSTTTQDHLLPEAAEMLLGAVNASNTGQQGRVIVLPNTCVQVGGRNLLTNPSDMRVEARYKHALEQLHRYGLLDQISESLYKVTYLGYLMADELAARGSEACSD